MQYRAELNNNDAHGGNYDLESCKLLDLLLLTEMVSFSLNVYDLQSQSSDDSDEAAPEPVASINLTQEILTQFDSLVISETANQTNHRVASSLVCRHEFGIFESLTELVSGSLMAYPDEEVAAKVLVQLAERVFLKAVTSPLDHHLTLANHLLRSLLENTDYEYHSKIASSIMQMIDALIFELKSMKQEPFKKKVMSKLCHSVSLILGHSNPTTCLELM